MDTITTSDLVLINNLSSRAYVGNTLLSSATESEKTHMVSIMRKLRAIADFFSQKYNEAYGPFETSVSSGNPIAIGGTNLKRLWSGIFKGATNKQYAAQISFVMNPREACLDVGFYFGSASGHSRNRDQRIELERQLNNLGISLSDAIVGNETLRSRYNAIFDFGYVAFADGQIVLPNAWYNIIRSKTKNAHITAKIYPNDFGTIENSTIDSFVSQVIFLMSAIRDKATFPGPVIIRPLTPEQRAKEAERLSQIGQKGELFAMDYETNRLADLGISRDDYPRHVALDSMHYGFDILSLDENGDDIFIEVKTTTRPEGDLNSRKFFISTNEFEVFENDKPKYRLYRVYDVENKPNIKILDLDKLVKKPDGYIVEY